MRKRTKKKSGAGNAAGIHAALVGRLVSETRPVRRTLTPGLQWALWFLLSGGSVGFFLATLGPQAAGAILGNLPAVLFLGAALLGSALAAWEAISSSLPGRQTGTLYRIGAVGLVLVLMAMPFLFFPSAPGGFDLMGCCSSGWSCIRGCCLLGFLPWVLMVFILSRNASLRPFWTGLWAGLSAFLLGAFAIQLHCPSWETGHMFVAHLLPVALLTFPAALAGAYWFSRWRK